MTTVQKIIDQELAQFGWVESIATNLISDFKSHKSNVLEQREYKRNSDLIDNFICYLLYYIIFCYSLFLYVFIDLGFGLFLRHKVFTSINLKIIFRSTLNFFHTFSKLC